MLTLKKDIVIQRLKDELFAAQGISVSVLRLDMIHPVVSGNKLFKLYYFMKAVTDGGYETVLTFGGAYSNHLLATAFVCREAGIKTIGYVRGERAAVLSHTLTQCLEYGMQLEFIPRALYTKKDDPFFLQQLQQQYPHPLIIPEGGYAPIGANGAALIGNYIRGKNYSHIACAVGTATTLSGLLLEAQEQQQFIGFGALKGLSDIQQRLQYLTGNIPRNLLYTDAYCFNGYAKKNGKLIQFMNDLYKKEGLPTDFIYTAKMMYGIYDMAGSGKFAAGSNILCIHTWRIAGKQICGQRTHFQLSLFNLLAYICTSKILTYILRYLNMRIAKYLFLLLLISTGAHLCAQDTLPHIKVINYNGRIVVSWISNYSAPVNDINIQRSFDSLKNYTTIGSVLNPQNRENGYADVKPPYNKMYYRVFISFAGGNYLFSEIKRPVKDTVKIIEAPAVTRIIDSIIGVQESPKPKGWISSRMVYTGKDNNIIINLPEAMTKKYSLRVYDEEMNPAFIISKIPETYLILERSNFVHAGWFYFELYDNGTLVEKNKFYVPKDAKSPIPIPEE